MLLKQLVGYPEIMMDTFGVFFCLLILLDQDKLAEYAPKALEEGRRNCN